MNGLKKAIKITGNQSEFARQLGVSPQFISSIINNKKEFPPTLCKKVKQITNGRVLEHELRPDVFDPPGEIERLAG